MGALLKIVAKVATKGYVQSAKVHKIDPTDVFTQDTTKTILELAKELMF